MGSSTIEKTMLTSFLLQGFWDRWIANDIPRETVIELRHRINRLEDWIRILQKHADVYENRAVHVLNQHSVGEAVNFYRLAAMHYNLIQWVFPETGNEKREWYQRCKDMHEQADQLVEDEIMNIIIQVEGNECYGRIRVSDRPKGCVIIINPIDSSKEEVVKYEDFFAGMGFATVSFDGPGQGETYTFSHQRATRQSWDLFVNEVIEFTALQFPMLQLYLFGTCLGGAWSIQGSSHPKICRTVSVSPVIDGDTRVPEYFEERLLNIIEDSKSGLLLRMESLDYVSPILLVHGKKDTIIQHDNIYDLYTKLPIEKRLIQYVDEGHGCNYRINEILKAAGHWYLRQSNPLSL
ncbi:alpha/beta hydrolase [Paenibacillus antarcticus]|nr:alpha/beta hydrolase [Paenibacillus antarcticus]